jgi:hypothetical protein
MRGLGATSGGQALDPEAVALSILEGSANAMAPALIPVAELSPQGSVVLNNNSVTTVTTTGGLTITWPCNGYLVGIRATTRDGAAASMAGCLLRVQIDGTYELFPSGASGSGAGFLPFAMISGSAAFLGRYAVRRRFTQTTTWNAFIQNSTGGTIVADLAFDYVNTSSPPL